MQLMTNSDLELLVPRSNGLQHGTRYNRIKPAREDTTNKKHSFP